MFGWQLSVALTVKSPGLAVTFTATGEYPLAVPTVKVKLAVLE
jgi:hypothetical protein